MSDTRRGFFARLAGLFLAPVAAKVAEPRDEVMEALEGMSDALAAADAARARRYDNPQTFLQNFGPIVQQHPEAVDSEALMREHYRAEMDLISGRQGHQIVCHGPHKPDMLYIRRYRDQWGHMRREDWYGPDGSTPPWRCRPTFADLCKRGVL